MKRQLLPVFSVFFLLVFCANQTFAADKVDFGVKGGFNISGHWSNQEKSGDDSVESGFTNGVIFGAMARFSLSDFFKLQPEILYVKKGSTQDVTVPASPIGTISVLYDLRYLEIPLVLKLYFLKGKGTIQPTFSLGPYLAFLLKDSYTLSNTFIGTVEQNIDGLRNTDMGVIFGSGIELKKESVEFSLQYRYSMGFVNLALPTGPGAPPISLRNYNYTFTFEIVFK